VTSSGYWLSLTARKCRLVKMPATQMGMTNQWLKGQGLLSVKEQWGTSITPLRRGSSWEPPSADPHARWCGEGEGDPPPYPIGHSIHQIKSEGEYSAPIFLVGVYACRHSKRVSGTPLPLGFEINTFCGKSPSRP